MATIIELEFDTSASAGAPLGDIASSLVSVDELLRDLATLAAYPSSAEYREIQVAAITMRNPLRVTLSLIAIPDEAVKAFQDICRVIIGVKPSATIESALARCAREGGHTALTEQESTRISGHVATLQRAEVRLKAMMVKHPSR